MCTVTYIPTSSGFYLTSNRDEKTSRATLPPKIYNLKGIELMYPKDELAGGTWIAADPNGKAACLLNGAFINHEKKEKYIKSRGQVLLESFQYQNTYLFADEVNLVNVEPFTLLTLDYSCGYLKEFYELKWDGRNKHLKKLNSYTPKIWSSATLYSPSVQLTRRELFEKWLHENQNQDDRLISRFHNRKHGLKTSEDILMKGSGDLMTLSITQIRFENKNTHFNYFDIINQREYKLKLTKKEMRNV